MCFCIYFSSIIFYSYLKLLFISANVKKKRSKFQYSQTKIHRNSLLWEPWCYRLVITKVCIFFVLTMSVCVCVGTAWLISEGRWWQRFWLRELWRNQSSLWSQSQTATSTDTQSMTGTTRSRYTHSDLFVWDSLLPLMPKTYALQVHKLIHCCILTEYFLVLPLLNCLKFNSKKKNA